MAKTKSDARFQEAKARELEAKAEKQKYIAQQKSAKANSALVQSIREQETRKRKEGNVFKKIAGTAKFSKKLSSNLLSYANAFGGNKNQGQSQSGPGRPKGVMKWRSPFNGKPIPATEYYKQVRAFRRMQNQKAEAIQSQQLQNLARKGIPPNQAQLIQERMQQQRLLDNSQNQINQRQIQQRVILPNSNYPQNSNEIDINQLPNGTVVPRGNNVWKFARGIIGQEGGLFGPVKKEYGTEKSFWN